MSSAPVAALEREGAALGLCKDREGDRKAIIVINLCDLYAMRTIGGKRGGQVSNWAKRLSERFRVAKAAYRTDLSSPENRRKAIAYERWFDHGFLRGPWTNMYQIAPGVWRSNHPTAARFERLAARGIRTIITLRGRGKAPWALLEREACARLGITLESVSLQSRKAPNRVELQALIALFRSVEKPFVMHCKSGADRAGLASAIYLIVIMGEPVSSARRMLSLRYAHLKWSKTGVLDMLLDDFAAAGGDFEEWLAVTYDKDDLQRRFDAR